MANYVQYSPWTDAAAYGRGLGDSLSQAMLQMPQQRAALAQQAAMEQTRQREEAQKLAQQESYQTGMLGVSRAQLQSDMLDRQSKMEQMRRENELHDAELRLKTSGEWEQVPGTDYVYNKVLGQYKQATPFNAGAGLGATTPPAAAPMVAPTGTPPMGVTPPAAAASPIMFGSKLLSDHDRLVNQVNLAKIYGGVLSDTNNVFGKDPRFANTMSNLFYNTTANPSLGVPAGLTNTPASAMMPGMTNAAPMRVGNYTVEPMP
jgi:hypothetical protein